MATGRGEGRTKLGGVLFGGVFAAVGIGFLFFSIIPSLYEVWQMQGWQPVQAEVLATDLDSHRSDNSTTYSVSARYRYRWLDRSYTGNRVGIDTGSDNVGDWHQQHYHRLRSARDNGRSITVWVNPADPQQSVIDRELRWGLFGFKMIFVVVFGGVGLGIIIFVLRHRPAVSDSVTPWLDNPAWRDNRIRSGGKAILWFLWVFGIVWLLFMIPLWMNAEELFREGLPFSLFPYLFPLIGVLVLVQALIKTLRWRRFGDALLTLHPFPGESDGKVAGRVELQMDHREQAPVEVRLSCIHVYWRRSGNKRERREEILWQDSQRVQIRPGARGGVVEFAFRPAAGLPPSSSGGDHHKWVVDISAKLAGPDLEHRFTIPVFARHESSVPQAQRKPLEQDFVLEDTAAAAVSSQPASTRVERSLGPEVLPAWLKMDYRGGGIELWLPMFRNLAMSIPLMLVGGIFTGVGLFLMQEREAPFFFALIFALVGSGLFLGGLYSLGNSLQVQASSRGVEVVRRIFGFPLRQHFAAGDVRGLDKRIGAQSGTRAFYRVLLDTRNGKRITLADSLPSASAADFLIEQLGRQLRLKGEAAAGEGGEELPPVALEMAQKIHGAQKWIRIIAFVIFALIAGEVVLGFLNF